MPEDCGRLVSVLAFYVFSCSCFRDSGKHCKPSRDAQSNWKEEIENGPSLFRRRDCSFQSSSPRGQSPAFGIYGGRSNAVYSVPSTADSEDTEHLENLFTEMQEKKTKTERITTVTVTRLPRIHPPVNEYHPPVVSALPGTRTDTAWMRLPPPTARAMRAINRETHSRKDSVRDKYGSAYDATSNIHRLESQSIVRNKLDEWKIVGTLKQAGGTDLRKPEDTVGMSEIPEEEKQHQVPEILSEGHWLKRRRVFTNLPELNGRRLVDIDGAIKFDQNLESPYHSTFSEPTEAIRRPAQVFARPYPIRSMSIGLDDDFYSN
ncbi:unnamed protein product [Tuber melanosporum]|uniref:(Perigord truffle) hypothetical protein n=1 Tax=Tuber melanosporum (strain Mel28) TaxID=656061 RepID=D5GC61_TUBMM|nr:uncharacterized protein GSTUM_00000520001 [Tuber melanosporum]CAZ82104.1 unnamed protein product [Tuber melanosporum]